MLKYPVIHLGELRRIVNELLEHAERVHGPELTLDRDYYWTLPSDAAYDLSKPSPLAEEVGSLGDSWEFLRNLSEGDIKQEGPSLMLIHAGPLLHYIGEKVGR